MIFLTGARLVTLTDEVTRQIQRFTEPPESNLEAGGILLGSYRGPHIEIVQCTTPMRRDARTRFGFVRRDPGHQRAADSAWRASGRTINFVGEWHSHPEDHPRPSNVDETPGCNKCEDAIPILYSFSLPAGSPSIVNWAMMPG